ncbi:MAG: phage holin family protein [Verrucomicrobiales bacterium]|nr:phage holin family protein [Verrucomicrobiales bacterium]
MHIEEPPPPPGPASQLREWVRALALYGEARGRLLQIETREASGRAAGIGIAGAIGLAAVVIAWLLAAPALVWIISQRIGWHWSRVALTGAGLHLLIGLLFLLIAKIRLRRWRPFEASLDELRRDRDSLTQTTSHPTDAP